MSSTSLIQLLEVIFPQVDTRLLRAVSIEHSKDADLAVEVVLSEVIPYISQYPSLSVYKNHDYGGPSDGAKQEEPTVKHRLVVKEDSFAADSFPSQADTQDEDMGDHTQFSDAKYMDPKVNIFHDSVYGSDKSILMVESQETSDENIKDQSGAVMTNGLMHDECINGDHVLDDGVCPKQGTRGMSATSIRGEACVHDSLNEVHSDCEKNYESPHHFDTVIQGNNHLVELHSDCTRVLVQDSVVQREEHQQNSLECNVELEVGYSVTDSEKPESSGALLLKSEKNCSESEMATIENQFTLNTVPSRHGKICRTDLIDEIIEDAKNNKKTLFFAMEAVINKMRDVEAHETDAEQAQEEAARGGLDILTKVEELKNILAHANDANDMHAGEVYGEKAILATEVKELQSRLLQLSDERDKSLAILDEMCQTLEARLAEAEEVRKAALLEKQEKEDAARNALAEQEAIMEKVVKESKILQQEIEENSKLQKFLMSRGCLVDTLLGEISVICQDVRVLKKNFDERLPLSKSISKDQTTCILASSCSSLRSTRSDLFEQGSLETSKNASPAPTVNGHSVGGSHEEERVRSDHQTHLDDGWDLFDNDAEFV